MGPVLFILVAAAGLALSARQMADQRKRSNAVWVSTSNELGLGCEQATMWSPPKISGQLDGVDVSVDVQSTGGKNNQKVTRYRVSHAAVGPAMALTRQAGVSQIARFFGKRDVEVGDPFFDDRVIVDSTDPEEIRSFLTPARRAVVLEVFDRWDRGSITHDSITGYTRGHDQIGSAIAARVLRMVAMAHVMSNPDAVERALIMQEQGNMADAVSELHTFNEASPNVFSQQLEAEVLVELGDHLEASTVFDQLAENLPPSDPDGWQTLANTPAPVTLPAPPQPQGTSLEQQAVIDDLFAAGRPSHKIVEQFEKYYVGQQIKWSGTVSNRHSYRHDNDFGEGPGVKATVLLGGAGRSALVSNEVNAIVQLPVTDAGERGDQLSFAGTLFRIDRFARKLYIKDAELTGEW